ncbi:MAG: peptidoglycan-binding protein [Romboutsia timonensis]
MKQAYGFTEFETIEEFKAWLNKQKVTRLINKLQVHHMYAPSYANWKTDDPLRRQYNTKYFHVHTNKWSDIAQHFSIFPDGHIVTGRSLNLTPVGIVGWNTNAICIEIYGNFDKDVMYEEQKNAIIACYALLAKKFNIPIDSSGIRPHCWFTASGTYLGDYNSSKSCKTCPGLKFFGGNTKANFEANFYPAVKKYLTTGETPVTSEPATPQTPSVSTEGKYIVRYLQRVLNEQYGLSLVVDGLYGPKTEEAIKAHYLKQGCKGVHVEWLQQALVNRGHKIDIDGSFGPATLAAVKAYQKSRGLTADGYAGVDTHKAIIND